MASRVVHVCNPSPRDPKQEECLEFEASLVYIVNFKLLWVTKQALVSENKGKW